MNKITIIGNLVAEPVARTTKDNINNCSFRVAVNEFGENKKTTYFDCTAWRNLADICQMYMYKGMKVYVEGKAHADPYIAKDGTAQGNVKISVQSVEFLSAKREAEPKAMEDMKDIDPDEIPF